MTTLTRNAILGAARELFGERGYNAVSTADIADAVGISKGNLTYHFQKKEDIMIALLEEARPHQERPVPTTLPELDADFSIMESVMGENAFYFLHHAQMAQISSRIREMQDRAVTYNEKHLTQALHNIRENGFIEFEESDCATLVNSILLTCIYWLPFTALRRTEAVTFRHQVWSLIVPYLTERGRIAYEDLLRP